MELKVWVEGIQRIVCGVNDTTTCQDVVFALAHATGKVGRFTLVERWRNNERLLAPQEYPLKILMKWGEYSNDIQFILRQSDTSNNTKQSPQSLAGNTKTPAQTGHGAPGAGERAGGGGSPARGSASPAGNPVGVVRGVPQRALDSDAPKDVPPYREPPPPYRSPPPPAAHRKSPAALAAPPASAAPAVPPDVGPEPVSYNSQYRELVSLVNHQREKLSNQQADLIKFDAEIGYWENKGREQDRQVELLQQQISSADNQLRISSEQVQALSYMEEESEMVKQKEKWIRSETALLRCKLAECEAELQQCRNKIRRLLDELQSCHHDSRGTTERSMLAEMESLQTQIQHAKHATDLNHLTAETLKREVGMLESAIMEKKRQVEQLVQEMKEANLQSLAGSTDELRHLLDGSCKAGSARRIIGSPRQLENAAPTNKNPHGVWV